MAARRRQWWPRLTPRPVDRQHPRCRRKRARRCLTCRRHVPRGVPRSFSLSHKVLPNISGHSCGQLALALTVQAAALTILCIKRRNLKRRSGEDVMIGHFAPRLRSWVTNGTLGAILALNWIVAAQAADPIKIGFSASLTGGLASSGKANLLAQQIWQEQINAQGGLLGRQVDLVYYDDQSSASTVPGIYAKLLDVDKVDLLM